MAQRSRPRSSHGRCSFISCAKTSASPAPTSVARPAIAAPVRSDLNGRSVKACTVFAVQADGGELLTVEGLANGAELHPLQQSFADSHGLQCGYCTPGLLTRAYRLLQENPNPTDEEIRVGISGNLCRCTGYQNIVKVIRSGADTLNQAEGAV